MTSPADSCYHELAIKKRPAPEVTRAGREARKGETMTLQERQKKALDKIGGAMGLLKLPEEVRKIVADCPDYETKVKMLELVASNM